MKKIRPFLIACLAVFLVACSSEDDAQAIEEQQETLQSISFRLAWVPDMAEAGVFVARKFGYFQSNGLEVKIEPGGFGLDPIRLVAAGSNDFGIAGAGNLLIARSQGVPVVAIAAEFQNTPVGFVTRADSGITQFEDFRGKRVGVQTGADTDVLFRALLAKHDMTSSDVREVPIQFDMGPFVNNLIDVLPAYVTNQPITLKNRGFDINVLTAKELGLQYYGNVFFTTEEMVRTNPELVTSFVRAIDQGWRRAIDDREAAIEAVAAFTDDFERSELEEIYEAVIPFILPDEEDVQVLGMTRTRWVDTAQVLIDAGLIRDIGDIDRAFTNQFISQ